MICWQKIELDIYLLAVWDFSTILFGIMSGVADRNEGISLEEAEKEVGCIESKDKLLSL